jgi:hypothetical protein
VDAVTQTSNGLDIVVGMTSNRTLSWFVPATNYLDSISGSVQTFSVGLDTFGYFDVFAVVTTLNTGNDADLIRYTVEQGWQTIYAFRGIDPLTTLSATSAGTCFLLGPTGFLFEYTPNTGLVAIS